ncbi:hypothetical protein BT63DRAFT_430933 [Microthyrium microscopicum]|uniref:PH domain-containing protein n=1 Tax=Microthyrium microscopicum TaxID=703497 RepID=A0A6A6UUR9_9PEZI|nr:hypothetical protein BT63DRAFT_430933 [Microthyrium microscopicum]
MVGMEKIEVLSKSYLVRWIQVNAGNTISWSLQPNKKSLNFGIFKHPGGAAASGLPSPPLFPTETSLETPHLDDKDKKSKNSKIDNGTSVVEKLEKLGMKCVSWMGKCEADKVSVGKFDVMDGEEGMYGLVFDNTFSKQLSKTATFVLMTYPTSAPPTSGHHLHFSQATGKASSTSLPRAGISPALGPAGVSSDSLPHSLKSVAADPRPRSRHPVEAKSFGGSTFYTGVLHKQRRKHNSYAKRFFSLDFTTGTLSYYRNRGSSALRGAIPLSLAAVGLNEQTREISVDSGAEVWHLKVGNHKDFAGWKDALERAAYTATPTPAESTNNGQTSATAPANLVQDEQEWRRAANLVGRVSGIRDAVRRLAKDTDPKYLPSPGFHHRDNSPARSASGASFDHSLSNEEDQIEKKSFWKRKTSNNSASGLFKRTTSSQNIPTNTSAPSPVPNGKFAIAKRANIHSDPDEGIHQNCMDILKDLDQVVQNFSDLITESRHRRRPIVDLRRQSTVSVESTTEEFYDAEDGAGSHSQLLEIRRDSRDLGEQDSFSDAASDSSGDFDEIASYKRRRTTTDEDKALFPSKAKSLSPLPVDKAKRRTTVEAPKQAPPSLISFLRKNVGKDLSTIAMPVSANEPTSLLQRIAEQLEYSSLLDAAAAESDSSMRLLYMAAFAISSFSVIRVKERVLRKPFTPMLGETFELVREDRGFRLLTEKISHRPLRMAIQAEAAEWTFLQVPEPVQKFWGKSAELNTNGRARVFLHNTSEAFSYTSATSFLRNMIAGEKYVEPVSSMTIVNEGTGAKAVVQFKAGGMFAGRSEEVSVQLVDANGSTLPLGAAGKWTSHLQITNNGHDSGTQLWAVGPLVDDASRRYGFTQFAAQLNEITAIEADHIPASDSRLRPDQRAVEVGDMDRAEALKAKLEERQRGRRRVQEEHGEEYAPRWFFNAGSDGEEEVWRLKTGKDGYWEERATGQWTGVVDVMET